MTPERSPILTTPSKGNGNSPRNNNREKTLPMWSPGQHQFSRRGFCICCIGSAAFAASAELLEFIKG